LGGLRGNVRTPSIAHWKARGRFFFFIEFFRYLLRLRRKQKSVKVGVFEGVGHFGEYFGWRGTIPSNPRWNGNTRDTPVSYGVKILTDDYFVLSQYTHLTDRRTDGRTDRIATAIYRALQYTESHGKKQHLQNRCRRLWLCLSPWRRPIGTSTTVGRCERMCILFS